MPLAQVSLVSDLDAIKKVLQDPLTGRRVLIPFTSKAFFEGSLQPTIATSSGKEQVQVKISKENFVETNRPEAMEMLEKRIQAVQETVRKVTKKKTAAAPRTKATAAEPSSGPLPFFEIREEFDEQGNEIKSEAINVAKELEYLQRNEDGKLDSAVRAVSSSKNQQSTELQEDQPATTKPVISEEEYQELTSRFNELARLEEQDESNKRTNQTSSKKLQGSGWAKGFLNKKKPATKKKPTAAPVVDVAPRTSTGKKVGFQEEANQIKEIPRVGERSVPSRTPTNTHTKPIETSVFNGVIQERPVTVAVQERNVTASSAAGVQERAAATSEDVPPKKELSRFAQQRLEQQQQAGASSEPTRKLSKFAQERQAQMR